MLIYKTYLQYFLLWMQPSFYPPPPGLLPNVYVRQLGKVWYYVHADDNEDQISLM